MRYIEVPGEINEHNQLILDESLDVIKPQRVKIDIWFRDEDEEEYQEETKAEILEGIREGFRDCLEGRISPVEEMWDELMLQSTGEINDEGQLILDEPLRPTKSQYVDVVIRFINNQESEEVSKYGSQIDRQSQTRELIGTEK